MASSLTAVSLICLQLSTTSAIVGFTSQCSPLRPVVLLVTALAAKAQLSRIDDVYYPVARAFLGSASIFLVVLYVDAALLSRWTYEAQGPTSSLGGLNPGDSSKQPTSSKCGLPNEETSPSPDTLNSFVSRLRFGFSVSLQSRFPGTRWPVKNIPQFSRRHPEFIPTRTEFLMKSVLKCWLYVFILRLSTRLGNPEDSAIIFSSDRIIFFRRLNDISAEETGSRVLGTLGYWTVQYFVIELLYSILAISAVSLHITGVTVWPPAFGSVDEAWSLRQFWG